MEEEYSKRPLYESFVDKEGMVKLLDEIDNIENVDDRHRMVELLSEKVKTLLDNYKEQPHLLDPHIPFFVRKLLENVYEIEKEKGDHKQLKYHLAMRFLYEICRVRGFKTFIRHLPHDVTDIEPVLSLLLKQCATDVTNWESSYVLLLWLSILIMLPFHLKRFDACDGGNIPLMLRIFNVIKEYLVVYGKCKEAAAFLCGRFLTRPEISKEYMQSFVDWSLPLLDSAVNDPKQINSTAGVMLAFTYIFKSGKRDDIIRYATMILDKIKDLDLKNQTHEYFVRLVVKLTQRIGLCFLKVKIARWRYSRGRRCLAENISQTVSGDELLRTSPLEEELEFDYSHLSEVETVIGMLLNSLKDNSTLVRWSAAKGIGRISERLSKEMGNEVVRSVLELFSPLESDSTWHGACLALAELCRRGLVLPDTLSEAVNVVMKALVFDELKGNFSVGAHVRDAACYVCWSFARAYDRNVMEQFVNDIATQLLIVSLFDREVNCRRAASAAFQEHVGRQGNFPNGIEIVTSVDHHAVGLRNCAFLELSVFVAKFSTYTKPLILHLLEHKVHHWDPCIRELSAKALYNLTLVASPEFVMTEVLSKLISNSFSHDLNKKHGSILSAAFVIHALREKNVEIPEATLQAIKKLSFEIKEKHSLRGVGGECMKHAVCALIEKSSLSILNFNDLCLIELWIEFLKETIHYVDPMTREHGLSALTPFCDVYLRGDRKMQDDLIAHFLARAKFGEEHSRTGSFDALRCIPDSMFVADTPSVILFHVLHVLHNGSPEQEKMVNAKAAGIKCLSHTLIRLDPTWIFTLMDTVKDVFSFFLSKGMDDYTEGARGDIGLVVRIAAINSLTELVLHLVGVGIRRVFTERLVKIIFNSLLPHCVSTQDKMRQVAATSFCKLLHSSLDNIPHRDELLEIFPLTVAEGTNWRDATTYKLFCRVLPLQSYTDSVLQGISSSVGGISASTVKFSREGLSDTLLMLKSDSSAGKHSFDQICKTFLNVFRTNLSNERLCQPLIACFEYLISSGFMDDIDEQLIADNLRFCWEHIRKSSNVMKIVTASSLFCSSLRFKDCCQSSLGFLVDLLFKRYPKVRVSTADSLYTAILTYGDIMSIDDPDAVSQLLVDNDWSKPLNQLQSLRNNLITAFGL